MTHDRLRVFTARFILAFVGAFAIVASLVAEASGPFRGETVIAGAVVGWAIGASLAAFRIPPIVRSEDGRLALALLDQLLAIAYEEAGHFMEVGEIVARAKARARLALDQKAFNTLNLDEELR
jgi:hypothetical protein